MSQYHFTDLNSRDLLRISGEDATAFLHGLVTCDIEHLKAGEIVFGALLSPQGKILFDFFILASTNGFILDVDHTMSDDLTKRLMFYRLRAKVDIGPMDERTSVYAINGNLPPDLTEIVADGVIVIDPRRSEMGARAYLRRVPDNGDMGILSNFHQNRILVGMPEGGTDFAFGDAFPHEVLMDQFKGVDFAKGCYVGQEVVSRMQHRGTARKRIIMISSDQPLPKSGCEILVAGKTVGEITSTHGKNGLAMVRLDRAIAHHRGEPALAGSQVVQLAIPEWCSFGWPES